MSESDLDAVPASNGDQDAGVPEGLVCPACGSKLIRRSMRRTFKDRFLSLFGRWPYRCQMCNMRFNGPQDAASLARESAPLEDEERPKTASKTSDEPDN